MQSLVGHRYELGDKLGEGGMGTVYRATDRLTGQTVALKRVLVNANTLSFNSRATLTDVNLALAREFRILASLRHPHIISVLDYGFDEQRQPYFTMPLLENAKTMVEAAQNRDISGRVELMLQLMQALVYLHRRGIIHRDLKSSNVLVDADGLVRVLDFGLALEAIAVDKVGFGGTLPYMAPELLRDVRPSMASDLYAAGVMLYEMMVGRLPFNNPSFSQALFDILNMPPDLSTFPMNMNDPASLTIETPDISLDAPPDESIYITFVLSQETREELAKRSTQSRLLPSGRLRGTTLRDITEILLAKEPHERYHDAQHVLEDLCTAASLPVPPESQAIRESFLQAARFVGREAEFDRLHSALLQTRNGQGALWLVAGESGVGKSRLLDELRVQALVEGVLVLVGQAVEGGGLPWQVWRDPLRRLVLNSDVSDLDATILKTLVPDIEQLLRRPVPDAPALLGSAGQERLIHAVSSLIQRQKQPILFILEDLQWTEESLVMLRTLLPTLANDARLVVGTYRDEERPTLPDELPGAQVLKLERLNDHAITALCASMIGDAARREDVLQLVKRESEGNTFFIVEVVRVLAEEAGRLADIGREALPTQVLAGGIEAIVRRRLQRVPEWGQSWLRLAAVYGRTLDLAVLRPLFGTPDDPLHSLDHWLIACAGASVLEVADNEWRFAHDKLRGGVLRDVAEHERPALHRQVAETMEAVYPAAKERQTNAEILMEHWRMANHPGREVDYALLVIDRWINVTAEYARARQLTERAMTVIAPDDNRYALLLNQHAETFARMGDWQTAKAIAEQAQTAAIHQDNRLEIARSHNKLGSIAKELGQYSTARDHFSQSLRIRRDINDQQGIGYSLNGLGMIIESQGDFALARQHYEQAHDVFRAIDDKTGMCIVLNNIGVVAEAQGDYAAARDYYQRSLDLAEAIGDVQGIGYGVNNLALIAQYQDDDAAADEYLRRGLLIFQSTGDEYGQAVVLNNLGLGAVRQRQWLAALGYFRKSLTLYRALARPYGMAEVLDGLSMVALELEDAAAVDYLVDGLTIAQSIGSEPRLLALLATVAAWLQSRHKKTLSTRYAHFVLHHASTAQVTKDRLLRHFPEIDPASSPSDAAEDLAKLVEDALKLLEAAG